MLVVAVVAAACSNAPSSSSAGTTGPTGPNGGGDTSAGVAKGVQFAQCMRSNGVTDFPDPNPTGQFTIDAIANGSGVDTSSPAFSQALNACKQLEPAGFTGTARSPQQQAAALKFAQCVRANGVTDFPDPTPDGPLIDTNRIPSAATSSGMSILNAAMRKCGTFARGAGVTGGK